MSIEASNITKLYGEQRALNNVSLSVASGEIIGFLGPNGAGKSTFMKILTGFITPSGGDALVAGYDIHTESQEIRKRVGYLPEHNPLYLDMYVREYLEFIGGLYHLKGLKNRVKEVIDWVGLEKEQHKKLGALSKGYRQRAGLAHAIIHDPEVLILDEPTTGLDPNQLDEIRKLIFHLGKEKTVLLSTHIMQEVVAICNRVVIIKNGEIVANEAASSIVENKQEVVLDVEFKSELSIQSLEGLQGISTVKSVGSQRFVLVFEGLEDPREQVFHFAVKQGNPLLRISKENKTLEEVFKELTNS